MCFGRGNLYFILGCSDVVGADALFGNKFSDHRVIRVAPNLHNMPHKNMMS